MEVAVHYFAALTSFLLVRCMQQILQENFVWKETVLLAWFYATYLQSINITIVL